MSNVVHFKAFLRDENVNEARRFSIEDPSVVTNFVYMKEKLLMVYPVLRETVFRITWKDEDGDEITIVSDEDLFTAITEMTENVKVLYLTVLEKNNADLGIEAEIRVPFGEGQATCDACDTIITGFRYKCMSCPDFDLCSSCEHRGLHSEHIMMRVPNSEMFVPRCARKFVNHFTRSLRKAQHVASKEAYRAAKYTAKAQEKHGDDAKAGSSKHEGGHSKPKCPMQDHMSNLGNLGYMAMNPIMDILSPNAPHGGQFAEAVRKAINTFFEGVSQQPENAGEPQPTTEQASTPAQTAMPTETSAPIPMDVEANPEEKKTPQKSDTEWTFVNQNQLNQSSNEKQKTDTADDPKITEGLIKLLEMGFSDANNLVVLLKKFDGSVPDVLKHLFEKNQ